MSMALDASINVSNGQTSASSTLQMHQISNDAGDSWLGVQASNLSLGLNVDPLTLNISNGILKYNSASAGNQKVDWDTRFNQTNIDGDNSTTFDNVTLLVGQTIDYAVSGDVAFSAFDSVQVAGSLSLTKQVNVTINDGVQVFQADVLSASISNASMFIGNSATLDLTRTQSDKIVVGADAMGISVSNASLKLLVATDRVTTTNKYTGLQATISNAGLVGLGNDINLTVSGDLKLNKSSRSDGIKVDWEVATHESSDSPSGNDTDQLLDLNIDKQTDIAVAGSVALDAFGFVVVTGSLAMDKKSNVFSK
jgi:hypothetical protein